MNARERKKAEDEVLRAFLRQQEASSRDLSTDGVDLKRPHALGPDASWDEGRVQIKDHGDLRVVDRLKRMAKRRDERVWIVQYGSPKLYGEGKALSYYDATQAGLTANSDSEDQAESGREQLLYAADDWEADGDDIELQLLTPVIADSGVEFDALDLDDADDRWALYEEIRDQIRNASRPQIKEYMDYRQAKLEEPAQSAAPIRVIRGGEWVENPDRQDNLLHPAFKVGETRAVDAHGKTLNVKLVSRGNYHLRVRGEQRARWASTIAEVRQDAEHFVEMGALPPAGESWA